MGCRHLNVGDISTRHLFARNQYDGLKCYLLICQSMWRYQIPGPLPPRFVIKWLQNSRVIILVASSTWFSYNYLCFWFAEAITWFQFWRSSCYIWLLGLIWIYFAEPDILREVKQKLDLGSVKFEVGYISLLFFFNIYMSLK